MAVQVCEFDHHGRLGRPSCQRDTLCRGERLCLALDHRGQQLAHLGLKVAEPPSVAGPTHAANTTLRKGLGNLTPWKWLCLTRPNDPEPVLASPRFLSRKSTYQPLRKHVLECQARAAAERTSSRPAHAHHTRSLAVGPNPGRCRRSGRACASRHSSGSLRLRWRSRQRQADYSVADLEGRSSSPGSRLAT